MNLTKTADLDKCGYGIWLNTRSQLLLPHITLAKNVFIFGLGNSLPVQVDNKRKISHFFQFYTRVRWYYNNSNN